jgi:hypothetical protein
LGRASSSLAAGSEDNQDFVFKEKGILCAEHSDDNRSDKNSGNDSDGSKETEDDYSHHYFQVKIVDDDEYTRVFEEIEAAESRAVSALRERQRKVQEEHDSLTNHDICQSLYVSNAVIVLSIAHIFRSKVTAAQVQNQLRETL